MSDDKSQDIINRGHRARFLMENETFQQAMRELDAEYVKQWRLAKDTTSREQFWHGMNALAGLAKKINSWEQAGRQRAIDIEQKTGTR